MKNNIFWDSNNLEAANLSLRKKSRSTDFFILLFLLIILVCIEPLGYFSRNLIFYIYIFIIMPVCISFGGTPGQILAGLRVRQRDNNLKNISLLNAYIRFVLSIFDILPGVFVKSKKEERLCDRLSNSLVFTLKDSVNEEDILDLQKKRDKIYFFIDAVIYIAWVIWLGNFYFLLGLLVIFDMKITHKINWTPWKRRNKKNSIIIEWLDALIFAVVTVTIIHIFLIQNYKIPTPSMEKTLRVGDRLFVSKVKYGPRIPNTPLAFPFVQSNIGKFESYSKLIQLPYKRLAGFNNIKRNDIIVFSFPAGDTVIVGQSDYSYRTYVRNYAEQIKFQYPSIDTSQSYYEILARKYIKDNFDIVYRPVDKRDNYVKRCVALPGDTFEIVQGKVIVNGIAEPDHEGMQYNYEIITDGTRLNSKILSKMDIASCDQQLESSYRYILALTEEKAEQLKSFSNVVQVNRMDVPPGEYSLRIFPHDPNYKWNADNFGPVVIPKKGTTVKINTRNICLYQRIINAYEKNYLVVKDSIIYINNKATSEYTFKMDYFFMMGDNRSVSYDSRFWGFVPEDHIVGAPKFIWLSTDKDKKFLSKIRWNRFFKSVG